MKNISRLFIISLACLLSACSTGRFLQINHPATGLVGVQFTTPNTDFCRSMLAMYKYTPETKEMAKSSSCSKISASDVLPVRATIRNISQNFYLDVETRSVPECKGLIEEIMDNKYKENLEIVSECAMR